MDNPAVLTYPSVVNPPKRPLTRANSTLTPTNKSWRLTQMPKSKLCRCNSVLVPKSCCEDDAKSYLDEPASLDYPFFSSKLMAKNIISDNSPWTKEFWSERYNRLHSSSPDVEKFPSSQTGVSTIYDPQFLSSKLGYSSSHVSGGIQVQTVFFPYCLQSFFSVCENVVDLEMILPRVLVSCHILELIKD